MSIRVAILAAAILASVPHTSHAQLIAHRDLSLKMALATPSSERATRTETANAGQRELMDVIPLGGGMPIKAGEDTIGGVGLSGVRVGSRSKKSAPTPASGKSLIN